MKHFGVFTFGLFLSFWFLSCDKSKDYLPNSQIIGFNNTKCGCCWGWIIKYGNDTIKTDSLPSDFKMDEHFPIQVKIVLGKMTQSCYPYSYYDIKTIERIK